MNVRILIVVSFFLITGVAGTYGVPAYPRKIMVEVDGKEIPIRLFGDENCHWAETADGYTIVQDSTNHWCYAVRESDGGLLSSSHRLKASPDTATLHFLQHQPLHLRPSVSVQQQPLKVRPLRLATASRKAVIGERRMLIILMEFVDRAFTKTAMDFERLFNEEGYREDGAQGSVRDFYAAASYGQLKLTCDVLGPYTASREMAYYGRNVGSSNSANAYALFEEAIAYAANETNLSEYDGDGDGYLDNVHIIFAGYGEEFGAEADAIWSHEQSFRHPVVVQGLRIDHYTCSPELRGNKGSGISRIGVCCHEIGHALGAMDFYDTDYEDGGSYEGTGEWDVMASGSHNNGGITPADFNPYVKAYNFGWITPKTLPMGVVNMQPSNDMPDDYYILQSPQGNDYYLLENRQRKGWGMALPGSGLLAYHIHKNIANAGNGINATHPQMCYLVCASSPYGVPDGMPMSYGGETRINSTGCPFPGFTGNTSFNASTVPAAFWWYGDSCLIDIADITQNDDYSITLTNESVGMIEPADTIVREFKRIFQEGFEQGVYQIAQFGKWQLEQSENYGIKAYKGDCYFLLSARNEYVQSLDESFEFSCDTIGEDGRIVLKVAILSNGLRLGKSNTLSVGYKTDESDEWQYESFVSTENDFWDLVEVELPTNISSTIQIRGRVAPLSLLAIDEIEVLQESVSETKMRKVSVQKNVKQKEIYTLLGRKAGANYEGQIEKLSPGIYIINQTKVLVK